MKPSADFFKRFLPVAVSILLLASLGQAGTEKVLHSFKITDGEDP